MSNLVLVLIMGAGVYLLRLTGLSLQELTLPPTVDRALRCVPVALLTGLVVVGLTGQVTAEPIRLLAVAAAALAAWRTGKMWACILTGMVVYWLTAWLLPG
ncbi:MAG: AzlD domain-containing protein [Chloroflexi bacterium]|nr:AzlD domain-containing protein [Chloroflexota bacterium]